MVSSTFWTESHFTGLALILGGLLFSVGAFMPLRDKKGAFIYGLPPREWLNVIFDHPRLWQWANILFMSGVVVTILGLVMLTILLRDTGDRAFSQLGLVAFVFGAVLWIINLAFRLSIDPWAVQETARTAVMPDFYVPLTRWYSYWTWWINQFPSANPLRAGFFIMVPIEEASFSWKEAPSDFFC